MRTYLLLALLIFSGQETAMAQSSQPVQQPREVVKAYAVVHRFQSMMAESMDFDSAFEATFTKSARRRREIAIVEGEFGEVDVSRVNSASLVSAFKSRTQIYFLTLSLMGAADEEERELLFPPEIKEIIDRKPSRSAREFPAFAAQLKRDAEYFRSHVERLSKEHPSVAERIKKFKEEALKEIEPPDRVVEPLTAYSRGRVLGLKEPYYRVGDYAVIRENGEMRIVGIRFFSRLF
jgi:hypothetical protein